jgi:hypothetical protein
MGDESILPQITDLEFGHSDDVLDVGRHTTLAGDGVWLSYEYDSNPFWLPSKESLFEARQEHNRRQIEVLNLDRKRTLVQRSEMTKPRVCPVETRATRIHSRVQTPFEITPTVTPRRAATRKLTTRELCDDKRILYRLQFFINKQNRKLERFETHMETSERQYQKNLQTIAEREREYKQIRIESEAALAAGKRQTDLAINATQDKRHDLRKMEEVVRSTRFELRKNQELLGIYKRYRQFLKAFCPSEFDILNFYKNPRILEDILGEICMDNLFIAEHAGRLQDLIDSATQSIGGQIDAILVKEKVANELRKSIIEVEDVLAKYPAVLEKEWLYFECEMVKVTQLVRKIYKICIGGEAEIGPIDMMHEISDELERMYARVDVIDPVFVGKKQIVQDKQRREVRKILHQKMKDDEQQRKFRQALERAARPIPRKYKRPLNKRVIPVKRRRTDEETKEREAEERRVNELLYGKVFQE